jgi:hypothetical protein
MIYNNQFDLNPGVYEHYKGGLYVVESILTHIKNEQGGDWERVMDPLVIYRKLEPEYEAINGGPKSMVVKTYARTLSNFKGSVDIEGKLIPRFKLA